MLSTKHQSRWTRDEPDGNDAHAEYGVQINTIELIVYCIALHSSEVFESSHKIIIDFFGTVTVKTSTFFLYAQSST